VPIISALLLLPCFWHKRIEAGDLPSHTYNAWLSQLIAQGQAPGLYIEPRWDNILSDIALAKLGPVVGFVVAEHVVVASAVLIFFWGTFALISAVDRRPLWTLVPAIAMIAYSWTLYAGFLNYYLSLGFAFWAVALFWRGHRADLVVGAALALLAFLAHPMGLFVLVGLAIYFRLSEILHGWLRWLLLILAFLVVLVSHYYVLLRPSSAYCLLAHQERLPVYERHRPIGIVRGALPTIGAGRPYFRSVLLCLRCGTRMEGSCFSVGFAGSS
jgi:hypothetical protein